MPRCRFLFVADLGDPISCIHVNDIGCMAGTMLGKVWLFSFDSKQIEMLTAFSEEGIRGLFLDEESGLATISEGCRCWRRASPNMFTGNLNFRSLERRNTQNVKHVLQRGQLACILFPITSTVVDVVKQEHRQYPFRLFDFGSPQEVAPFDFDGESLIVVDRSRLARCPVYRIVQLESNEHVEVSSLPKGTSATQMKLWAKDFLVYVLGGSTLYVYDYKRTDLRFELRGHRAEITAIDAQDDVVIASLSLDAEVKLWNGHTGVCMRTVYVPEASFFMGFPYFLCVRDRSILISADEGVYLLELEAVEEAVP
jgi:WD40 repeat protein